MPGFIDQAVAPIPTTFSWNPQKLNWKGRSKSEVGGGRIIILPLNAKSKLLTKQQEQ